MKHMNQIKIKRQTVGKAATLTVPKTMKY